MKKIAKTIYDRAAGPFNKKFNEILSAVNKTQAQVDALVENSDVRLLRLKKSLKNVEEYQPLYGLAGLVNNPARDSRDRADLVLQDLDNNVVGTKILDIGSSLGYMPFYYADRGAITIGWDFRAENVEVCLNLRDIIGSPAEFHVRELDLETVELLKTERVDVITIFSVLHHTIAYNGLDFVQNLMKKTLDYVPVMYVELALKGENPKLFWNKTLPKDELEIFAKCQDITIEKLSDFSTHLSSIKRPLYKITNNFTSVNNKKYLVKSRKFTAYKNAKVGLQRTFIESSDVFIKQYEFNKSDQNNRAQIINEINFLLQLPGLKIPNLPELVDFELSSNQAKIVFNKISGQLVSEVSSDSKVDAYKLTKYLINTLSLLEKNGWYHNDLRSWNVMASGNNFSLIDFGLVNPRQIENNKIALLWLVNTALTGKRESDQFDKTQLPAKTAFSQSKLLSKIYSAIAKNPKISFEELNKLI